MNKLVQTTRKEGPNLTNKGPNSTVKLSMMIDMLQAVCGTMVTIVGSRHRIWTLDWGVAAGRRLVAKSWRVSAPKSSASEVHSGFTKVELSPKP